MARNGTEAIVLVMPMCDIHKYNYGKADVPAGYDAKTYHGPWAYVCQECFESHTPGCLGTGVGQRLVLKTDG